MTWSALGAAPEVDHLYPAGAQRGSTVNVTVAGTLDGWPFRAWTDDAGLAFECTEIPGQLRVTLRPEARLGPHLVRFYSAEGCSAPCLFVAGDGPEIVEPDVVPSAGAEERVLALPLTANGRLTAPGEVDAYVVALEPGQLLEAGLVATRLDAPRTARLRLVGPDGVSVGTSTNQPPEDPSLEVRARLPGKYRLLVEAESTEGTDRGSTNTAVAATASPGVGDATGKPGVYRLEVRAVAARQPTSVPGSVLYQSPEIPGSSASVTVRADARWDMPEHPDTLPPFVDLPSSLTGVVNPAGDEDRFGLEARQDERYRIQLLAGAIESPLMPLLRILDPTQRIVAEAGSKSDVSLDWVAPWDGTFTVSVTDSAGRGGAEYRYALEIGAPEPHLTAEVSGHTWRARPGEDVLIPVKLRRPETHRRLLTVTAAGLPVKVRAFTGLITPSGVGTELRLRIEPAAEPVNIPFQVTLMDVTGLPVTVLTGHAPLRGHYAPAGGLLLNETETLWLTVVSPDR